MKKISGLNRAVQRHPVLMHLLGVVTVPVMIVFLPIVMYAIAFPTELSFLRALQQVPWGPVLLVIAIAAALSLLQMPWGVGIQASEPEEEETEPAVSDAVTLPSETGGTIAKLIDSPTLDEDEEEGGEPVASIPEKTL